MGRPVDLHYWEIAEDILAFLTDCQTEGVACALCTVTNVTGGSARSAGTLVAVRADGKMAGYVSHGCIDADLALQAVNAIETGAPKQLTYGAGSAFIDLVLPCGGTVEILIDPNPDHTVSAETLQSLRQRRPVNMCFTAKSGLIAAGELADHTGWQSHVFVSHLLPRLRLAVAGVGPPLAAIAGIAGALHIPVDLLSPDETAHNYAPAHNDGTFIHLMSAEGRADVSLDPWTAMLLVFHDHDWEPGLIQMALQSDAFYIGALGSHRTHSRRLDTLRSLGVSESELSRITGPIGVIPSARDAKTLAVSVMAEIADAYRGLIVQTDADHSSNMDLETAKK